MPARPPFFRPRAQRSRRDVNAEYDARRGSARDRGYAPAWDKFSAVFKRQHPLCLGCEAVGRTVATDVTDHVEPHRGDMVKFWAGPFQPACRWHHAVIKQHLEELYAKGQAKASDLWLNSKKAMELTHSMFP